MAFNSRVNPARDIVIISDVFSHIDPSADNTISSKIVIDAIQKGPLPDVSLPPKEFLWKAYESWKEAGLPEFALPKRVEQVLDFHAERMKKG
jgi:3-polyprenyl-4-hydroxybenzoate decarboxylase